MDKLKSPTDKATFYKHMMWNIACDTQKSEEQKKFEMKPLSEEMWIDLNGHPGEKKDEVRTILSTTLESWIKQCDEENKNFHAINVPDNVRKVNSYVRRVRHDPNYFTRDKQQYMNAIKYYLNKLDDDELKMWWNLQPINQDTDD